MKLFVITNYDHYDTVFQLVRAHDKEEARRIVGLSGIGQIEEIDPVGPAGVVWEGCDPK